MNQGQVHRFSLPRGSIPISHLAFADDILLYTKAMRNKISTLFSFLAKYEAVSGQCINQTKSYFYVSKRVSPAHLRVIASISGIEVGHLPFKYLGCTLLFYCIV